MGAAIVCGVGVVGWAILEGGCDVVEVGGMDSVDDGLNWNQDWDLQLRVLVLGRND
jgi:hypothetical protein